MPWVGFEPTSPAFQRAKLFHALDRAASLNTLRSPSESCLWSWSLHSLLKAASLSRVIILSGEYLLGGTDEQATAAQSAKQQDSGHDNRGNMIQFLARAQDTLFHRFQAGCGLCPCLPSDAYRRRGKGAVARRSSRTAPQNYITIILSGHQDMNCLRPPEHWDRGF
jgi:hypothetical protein